MTKKSEQAPAPSPLLDSSGNPSLVSPGELIESAWGNSVAGRVVHRFPNDVAMNAYSASGGALAVRTDLNIVYIRQDGAWVPTGVGNHVWFRGVGISGGQVIGPTSLSICGWNFTDPFNVVDNSTLTVPTGWGGRWVFDWAVRFPDGGQTGARLAFCSAPPLRLAQQNSSALEGGTLIAGSASAVLVAGDQVNIVMYHTDSSGPLTCNTSATEQYFQGYYNGPF